MPQTRWSSQGHTHYPVHMLAAFALFVSTLACQQPEAAASPQGQVQWERSLDDALWAHKQTGKPLLIAVNMDGEVFCEQFAGTVYRSEEFVTLSRGYVCMVVSPDRHTPMDFDGLGRRIECPRFGGITCAEHQLAEPELFRRWFSGTRSAPRHLGIGKDDKVLFDKYLASRIRDHLDAIREHAGSQDLGTLPDDDNGLLASRTAMARNLVEQRYRGAAKERRLQLLTAAAKSTAQPFDLLRMALRDDDPELFAAGATALAATAGPAALIDVQDALARLEDGPLQAALEQAWERSATAAPDQFAWQRYRAARSGALAGAGLASHAPLPLRGPAEAAPDREALEAALDAAEKRVKAEPKDAAAWLDLAALNLDLGTLLAADGARTASLSFEDALRAAKQAEPHVDAARSALLSALLAAIHFQLGDDTLAVEAAKQMLTSANALGEQAALGRRRLCEALRAMLRAAAAITTERTAADAAADVTGPVQDAAMAATLLVAANEATEQDLLTAAGMLEFAGARALAQGFLARARMVYPAVPAVHERFRNRMLVDRGAEALRADYAAYVAAAEDKATASWFAGYAAIVAAELHMKDKRFDAALASYTDCIDRFDASVAANADYADSANHFAVLALAGRALLRHQQGAADAAVDDLLRARSLRAASMEELDGLGRKPSAIAERISRELRTQGKAAAADRLGG